MIPNLRLIKSDFKNFLINFLEELYYGSNQNILKSRIPVSKIKKMIYDRGLAFNEHGEVHWFYTAYDLGGPDSLTNYTLDFICKEIPKNASLLVTGCGTGRMLFYLMDQGFKNVEGFDYTEKCVLVANDIAKFGGYPAKIWHDNGLKPSLQKKYDLITVMHWLFSAWAGNYGNTSVSLQEARSPAIRERLLTEFLSNYVPFLNSNGLMIVELIDAVSDYRLPFDGRTKVSRADIYPVRHTPGQVDKCAKEYGLEVVSYKMSCTYGHHPRTSYVLKKP